MDDLAGTEAERGGSPSTGSTVCCKPLAKAEAHTHGWCLMIYGDFNAKMDVLHLVKWLYILFKCRLGKNPHDRWR